MKYKEAILKRIADGYNHKNKVGELKQIRKDAVYSVNVMLTGSHEELSKVEKNRELFEKWIEKNKRFCIREFSEQNIVRFAVHMDEKTPHIHCVFVPITPDGRLSAGDWVGNGRKLEDFQTRYAEEMKEFGLERGIKSERKHHTTEEYCRREEQKLHENREILENIEKISLNPFTFRNEKDQLKLQLENLVLSQAEEIKKETKILEEQNTALLRVINNQAKYRHQIPIETRSGYVNVSKLHEQVNLVNYFFKLEEFGKVKFEKKSGKLVSLNSVINLEKFIEYAKSEIQNSKFKTFLCLDGDKAGNLATKELKQFFPYATDSRELFGISENENKDLNQYWVNCLKAESAKKTQQKFTAGR